MQSWPNPIPLPSENQTALRWEVFVGSYRFNVEDLASSGGGADVDHERFSLGKFLDLGLLFVFACGFHTE